MKTIERFKDTKQLAKIEIRVKNPLLCKSVTGAKTARLMRETYTPTLKRKKSKDTTSRSATKLKRKLTYERKIVLDY